MRDSGMTPGVLTWTLERPELPTAVGGGCEGVVLYVFGWHIDFGCLLDLKYLVTIQGRSLGRRYK